MTLSTRDKQIEYEADLLESARDAQATPAQIAALPELVEALLGMWRISSLWLPTETSEETRGEAMALHSARTKIINALTKAGVEFK